MSKKQKYFCPMVYNALEIETTGAFSPCCITTKQYRNDDGEKFNVATDSISTVMASQDRKEFVENFDDYFESKCKHHRRGIRSFYRDKSTNCQCEHFI